MAGDCYLLRGVMPEHRYQQYCGLARALDLAGDRWTLLIVRELVPGPRRFIDLIDGLPGISRNLLTERLRALERDGLLARRELPPPAARQVYELTDDGRDLAEAVVPLIAWGARHLGEPAAADNFNPRWAAVGMASLADRHAMKDVSETYQYVVGGVAFYFTVDHGSISVHDGDAPDPAVTVTIDEQSWEDLISGKAAGSSAKRAEAATIAGDAAATERLQAVFRHMSQLL